MNVRYIYVAKYPGAPGAGTDYIMPIRHAAEALLPTKLVPLGGGPLPPMGARYADKIEACIREVVERGAVYAHGDYIVAPVDHEFRRGVPVVEPDDPGFFAVVTIEGWRKKVPWVRHCDGEFIHRQHRDWTYASRRGNRVEHIFHLHPGSYTTSDGRTLEVAQDGTCVEV